jgi:glutaredoxin
MAGGLRRLCFVLVLSLLMAVAGGASAAPPAPTATEAAAVTVVDVFVREGCPHCADAKAFLDRLAAERTDLQVVYHPVDADPQARDALIALSQAVGAWPPGVPTFIVDGQMLIGFDDAEHSGRELLAMIDRAGAPADTVETRLFGTLVCSDQTSAVKSRHR